MMPALWIVHRDPALRAALVRLAGAAADTPAGAPGSAVFDAASAPDAILMGLAGDLESELEFAHRMAPRLRGTRWILVGDWRDQERAHALFDTLPAVFFTYPPEASVLRSKLEAAARRPEAEPLPLSQRLVRDALSERFARAFSDLDLPELLHAFDPRLGQVSLLALGEPGSGRGTLVRYVHQFGPTTGGTLVELDCRAGVGAEELLERIALAGRHDRARHATSLWLRDADRLAPAVQCEVAGWIEYGLPWGAPRTRLLRWFGTAEETGLERLLRRALGGLCVTIPPLRERPGLLPNLASATVAAWCAARGLRHRRLGEDALAVLEEYPWPGNLRELEAVIGQSLAASGADPLGADDLVLDGVPFVPLEASELGVLLEEEEEELPLPEAGAELDEALETLTAPQAGEEILAAVLEPEPAAGEPEPELATFLEPEVSPGEPELSTFLESESPPGEPATLPTPEAAVPPAAERSLQRLAAAVGHELRNPLTAVRTFAELLPERYDDPDFRSHFARLTAEGLGRVEEIVGRLERLAALPPPERQAVDVGGLLEEVLEQRRAAIHRRRLVVLEELDRSRPTALCDPEQLRFAFEALLDKSLELVPERGDVYLASRRLDPGLAGGPCVRVLLRYRGPATPGAGRPGGPGTPAGELSPAANALEFAIAEMVVRAQGGSLALDTSDSSETVLVLDLPA